MKARQVLDSYAVLAFLENEAGADEVGEMIKHARDSGKPIYLSVINWGEVYYISWRAAGRAIADRVVRILDTLPIEVVHVDREAARLAAEFKAEKKMSYADCFAAALAKLRNAALVTGDKDFKQVEDDISVIWL